VPGGEGRSLTYGRPPSRWLYLLSLAVAVGGLAVFMAVAGITSVATFLTGVDSLPRAVIPGEADLNLSAGDYTGYYESRSVVDGRVYDTGELSAMSCRMTNPSGNPVELRTSGTRVTYNVGAYSGQSQFIFHAPQDGRYTLACAYQQQEGPSAAFSVDRRGRSWAALTLLGVFSSAVAGLGACALVFLRRRSTVRAAPPSAPAPSAAMGGPPGASAAPAPGAPGGPRWSGGVDTRRSGRGARVDRFGCVGRSGGIGGAQAISRTPGISRGKRVGGPWGVGGPGGLDGARRPARAGGGCCGGVGRFGRDGCAASAGGARRRRVAGVAAGAGRLAGSARSRRTGAHRCGGGRLVRAQPPRRRARLDTARARQPAR
jgi:hypothetical protein